MTDHLDTLRQNNEWRKGCRAFPAAPPAQIGEAIDKTIAEVVRLRSAVDRCYRMLLTEPDTRNALYKAENILREAGAK